MSVVTGTGWQTPFLAFMCCYDFSMCVVTGAGWQTTLTGTGLLQLKQIVFLGDQSN